jgi:small subunit ribosomal protein S17
MNKTAVVRVERMVSHPLYGKKVRRFKNYLSHDEENRCQKGDPVLIRQSRPYSKKKTFEVLTEVESAKEGGV